MNYQDDHTLSLYISHAFINCLFAGYQGKYASLNVLAQLDSRLSDEEELERIKTLLDTINLWGRDLWDERALVNAGVQLPLSNDVNLALDLLGNLKHDLEEHRARTELYLENDITDNPMAVEFLLSSLARYAYTKDNYIKGLIQYGRAFGLPDVVDKWMQHMPYCMNDIRTANFYFYTYRDEQEHLPDDYYHDLANEARDLPYIFGLQINDIIEVFEIYHGSFGEPTVMQ